MKLTAKIIPGLIALLFLFMGFNFLFDPVAGAQQMSVEPVGTHGLNTLRGDFGGLFLTCGVLLIIGIVRTEGQWFIAVAVAMGLIALGRVVGFVLDGSPSEATLTAFGVEVVIAVALVFANSRLGPQADG